MLRITLILVLFVRVFVELSAQNDCCGNLGLITVPACPNECNGSVEIVTNLPSDYDLTWYNAAGQIVGVGWSLDSLCADSVYTVIIWNIPFDCYDTLNIHVERGCCIFTDYEVVDDDCAIKPTGSITVTPYNGAAPYTIAWSDDGAGFVRHDLPDGEYQATVTDAVGCQDIVWVTVGKEAGPAVTLSVQSVPCGATMTVLSVQATGNAPLGYFWSTGQTLPSIVVGEGLYSITVTDGDGCTASATSSVILPNIPSIQLTVKPTSCANNDGEIDAVILDTDTLHWHGPNGYNKTTIGTPVHLEGLSPGVYTAVTTNQFGCTGSATAVVVGSVLPENEHECIFLCSPDSVYGSWVTHDTLMHVSFMTLDSCPYVRQVEVVFVASDTLDITLHACAGQKMVVGAISIDSTQTFEIIGDCGAVTVDAVFAFAPDTVETYRSMCADTSAHYEFTRVIAYDSIGCPTLLEKLLFEFVPYTIIDTVIAFEQTCGLVGDTLHERIGTYTDACTKYELLREVITNQIEYTLYNVYVCNEGDSVFWDVTGRWHMLGVSSFMDSIHCQYHILDVNLEPKPLDSLVYGTSCDPDSVGIWLVERPGCMANIIRVVSYREAGSVVVTSFATCDSVVAALAPEFVGMSAGECPDSLFIDYVYYQLPIVHTHVIDCDIGLVGIIDTIVSNLDSCTQVEVVDYVWAPDFFDVFTGELCYKRADGQTHVRDTIMGSDGCWGIIDSFFVYNPEVRIDFDTTCDRSLDGLVSHVLNVTTDSCDIEIRVYWRSIPPHKTTSTEVICQGESIVFNGVEISTAGTYSDLVVNELGCVDTVELAVVVLPEVTTYMNQWVCPGDSVLWNGRYFTAGSYTDFYTSSWGCDSVATLSVFEIPKLTSLGWFAEDTVVWHVPLGTDVASYFDQREHEREFFVQWLLGDSTGLQSVMRIHDEVSWLSDTSRSYHIQVESDSLLCSNYDIRQIWVVVFDAESGDESDTCKVFVAPNPVTKNTSSKVFISGVRDYISLGLEDVTGHSVWTWSAGGLGNIPTTVQLPSLLPAGLYWLTIFVPELPEYKRNWAIQILYL